MKISMIKIRTLAITVVCLFCATAANAQSRITWVNDIEYRGELSYQNAGFSLTYAQSDESALRQLVEQAREITDIETTLYATARAALLDFANNFELGPFRVPLDVDRFSFDLIGPIVVELTGNANGTITARVGGFSIDVFAEVSNSGWFLEGSANLTSNTLWLVGDYSIFTGRLENLQPENFTVNIGVDADWILDWVPGVMQYIQQQEEMAVNDARSDIVDELNAAIAQTSGQVFFRLEDAIPDNTFVFGNFDAGQELRDLAGDLFVDLVSGESFRLELMKTPVHYNSVAPLYSYPPINPAYTTLAAVFDKHRVSINISDHFFLEVEDIPKFFVQANPYCSWVYCHVPANTDPTNTPENPSDIQIEHPNGDVLVIPYGLDFDFASLQLLFDANTPPPPPPNPFSPGVVVASAGSYGNSLHPLCSWNIVTGLAGARNLICNGSLTATQRVVTNYGTYTVVSVIDHANFQMVGSYPNYRISAK